MSKTCKDCRWLGYECDHDDHHIFSEWFTCAKRPSIENLKQFPFQKTGCTSFTSKPVTQ